MSEESILLTYEASRRSRKDRLEAVNSLRHLLMDGALVDVSNDASYMSAYLPIMGEISRKYPFLSWEVQRQVGKKRRRQARRLREERESELHL